MKKVLTLFLLAMILGGCAPQKIEHVQMTPIIGYPVDMSGYQGVSSTNHNFLGISPDELLKLIDEKGSAIVYMGYTGCHVCQEAARYINETAQELDVTVYYLDCTSNAYPLTGDIYDAVVNALDPILNTNDQGEKTIFTPHVFTIVNGTLNKGHISLVESWDTGHPGDASIKELKSIYADLMRPFTTESD